MVYRQNALFLQQTQTATDYTLMLINTTDYLVNIVNI